MELDAQTKRSERNEAKMSLCMWLRNRGNKHNVPSLNVKVEYYKDFLLSPTRSR